MVAAPLPAPPPRRVSYVIPPPSHPPPLLSLPPFGIARRGHTTPLFEFTGQTAEGSRHKYVHEQEAHPRHRLPVQALALDMSTALSHDGVQDASPDGILYTGGRDGLLCSWELGLPTKRRRRRYGSKVLDDKDDDDEDDDDEDETALETDDDEEAMKDEIDAVDLADLTRRPLAKASTQKQGSRTGVKNRTYSAASSSGTTKPEGPGGNSTFPIEEQWEIDHEAADRLSAPPVNKFRQCVQSHTDWVNDIVLCNYNRTLVSASSDSLVLAWNPHSNDHHDQVTPTQIGQHGDYVRCLATARETHWVASGGFDRKIKLWDIAEGRNTPLNEIVELPSPPASVYSLGTTPTGSLIGAGTPERVVRIWDPRSRKQVSRLGGHTDNIRAVLISDEGKWVLSASSDSTVKLWSLAAQKCLHTFSHHDTSVWALFSQHPSLEIFYSGDRNGNICKIDLEGTGEPGEGECIVLARDGPEDGIEGRSRNEGITQLIAHDDSWVWSAGGSSTVKRWKDVPPRSKRLGPNRYRQHETASDAMQASDSDGVLPGYQHLDSRVDLASSPARAESPTVQAPSSVNSNTERDRPSVSFLETLSSPLSRTTSSPNTRSTAAVSKPTSIHRPSSLRTPRQSQSSAVRPPLDHLPSSSASNPMTLFDIPYDSLVPLTLPEDTYFAPAFHNRHRDADSSTIHSTFSSAAPGLGLGGLHSYAFAASSSSIRRARSLIEPHEATNIAQRAYFERESGSEATPLRSAPDDIIEGGYGLVKCELLSDRQHALTLDTENEVGLWDIIRGRCIGIFASEELQTLAERRPSAASGGTATSSSSDKDFDLIEYVKDRIEGEVSIATWCKCDTRVGALTVHLEESRVFDAEAYIDECGVGPREDYPPDHRLSLGRWVLRQLFDGFIEAEMALRVPNSPPPPESALFGAAIPTSTPNFISLAGVPPPQTPRTRGPRTPGMTIALATPAMKKALLPDMPGLASPRAGQSELAPIPGSPAGPLTPTANGSRTPTFDRPEADYFSLVPATNDHQAPSNAPLPSTSSMATTRGSENASPLPTPTAPPGTGTLMGRLKMLGKGTKRSTTATEIPTIAATVVQPVVDDRPIEEQQQSRVLDAVFSRPLAPCSLVDAPRIQYNPDMAVIISEETSDTWAVRYRGLVGTSYEDMSVLEQKAPLWLLDLLLGNRVNMREPAKVSFVLHPWKQEGQQSLPDLPNANARLTANRSLRVRKVCAYIADKLDLRRPSRAPSIMDGLNTLEAHPAPAVGNSLFGEFNPEQDIEILVNDQVLPVNVTLATIRHCLWKNGGDVILSYRSSRRHDEDDEDDD
ncbi:uncharacterized protein JCM15063_003305 [Sporobolomyces koalae]|uniref:uncharacterized protein n=1 Tax=Sporobolomyces koalae TaxID=500713 RepID=UPI00317817DB